MIGLADQLFELQKIGRLITSALPNFLTDTNVDIGNIKKYIKCFSYCITVSIRGSLSLEMTEYMVPW